MTESRKKIEIVVTGSLEVRPSQGPNTSIARISISYRHIAARGERIYIRKSKKREREKEEWI